MSLKDRILILLGQATPDVIESAATRNFYLSAISFPLDAGVFGQRFIRPTGFLGFLFPTPVNVVKVGSSPFIFGGEGNRVILDNFVFKTVPEPSTLLLFGSALAVVQGVRLRRSRPRVQRISARCEQADALLGDRVSQ